MATKTKTIVRDSYLDLIREHPLRTIRSAAEHKAAVAIVRRLMMRPEDSLDAGESDYLDVLTTLIHQYERQTMPVNKGTVADRLRFVLNESGMSQVQFGQIIGLGPAAASLILSGKRSLTTDAVKRLAEHFKLDAGYFL
ncbi:MAG: helix-turn-helix domain-containing protein [Tepidisphaeraceae bacterium]